jgi:hypothetical protein
MRVVGFITQPPVILEILNHIGRRFDPLKLPGRSPPLPDHFCSDPFPGDGRIRIVTAGDFTALKLVRAFLRYKGIGTVSPPEVPERVS